MKPEYAKPFVFACIALGLVALLVWRFHPNTRAFVAEFFYPFEKGTQRARGTDDSDLMGKSKVELIDKVETLQDEVERLRAGKRTIRHLLEENRALRRALEAPKRPGYKRVTAHVFDRDPAQGGRIIRLDRGSSSGIRPGFAVMAGGFLIGRVKETTEKTATVTTVIDPNCKVPARVVGMQAHGILFGAGEEGWKRQPYCIMKHLPRDLEYEEGREVVTSPYSELMPSSLPIGKLQRRGDGPMVLNVHKLYKNVWVKPAAFEKDFSVLVVLVQVEDGSPEILQTENAPDPQPEE